MAYGLFLKNTKYKWVMLEYFDFHTFFSVYSSKIYFDVYGFKNMKAIHYELFSHMMDTLISTTQIIRLSIKRNEQTKLKKFIEMLLPNFKIVLVLNVRYS